MKNKKDENNKTKVNKTLIAVLVMLLGASISFGGLLVAGFAKIVGMVMICVGGVIAGVSTMFF